MKYKKNVFLGENSRGQNDNNVTQQVKNHLDGNHKWWKLTNLETNNSYNPSKCMSFIGTWLPIWSASNLLVKTVPIFWMPMYDFREGSCTGTNAGHKLQNYTLANFNRVTMVFTNTIQHHKLPRRNNQLARQTNIL